MFKEAWGNLKIISDSLSNENAIWPKSDMQDKWKQVKIICLEYFYIKALVENRFDNIGVAITISREDIDLHLIDKSRKKTYKEVLGEDNNVKGDLDNNVIGKSIYIFSRIRYTKTKTYKRYIYIRQ